MTEEVTSINLLLDLPHLDGLLSPTRSDRAGYEQRIEHGHAKSSERRHDYGNSASRSSTQHPLSGSGPVCEGEGEHMARRVPEERKLRYFEAGRGAGTELD